MSTNNYERHLYAAVIGNIVSSETNEREWNERVEKCSAAIHAAIESTFPTNAQRMAFLGQLLVGTKSALDAKIDEFMADYASDMIGFDDGVTE